MSDRVDLLASFSRNWAGALVSTVQSRGGRVLCERGVVATDAGRPAGLLNSVVLLEPLAQSAVPALVATLEAFFAIGEAAPAATVYLFTVWPVPDLAPFGWACVEQMPLMLRPPGGSAPPTPPDLRIAEGQSVDDLHCFEQVMITGFPVPELQELPAGSAFGAPILDDERFRFWLGWHAGRPVTAAGAYVAHGLVNLAFLATLPQARGRGFGSALAWAATLAAPDLPAMVIASEDGQRLYARLGYQHVCDMPLWVRARQ